MNICIFDTETISVDKPFCYNIGYVIVDTATWDVLLKKDFVVEQIWHNNELFNTAHYAEKKPIYVAEMRKHNTRMTKYGYICREMLRDFSAFSVEEAYAYNCDFDDRVFNYNCDWFKCANPFDAIGIHDIRGFVHNKMIDNDYKKFCDDNFLYTKAGNYSTTAEDVYRYLLDDATFKEDHTALSDSLIELEILKACKPSDAELKTFPVAKQSIERPVDRTLHIKTANGKHFNFKYKKIYINKDKTEIVLH